MVSRGWPFLVGRGRRAGHRVLLAPNFLVTERDEGILEAMAPEVTAVTSSAGQKLTIACSTHPVSAHDVSATERPRDEHGRPLRFIYGIVAAGAEPVNADLPVALATALDTYRRFLRREQEFCVESSTAFEFGALATSPVAAPAAVMAERHHSARRVALLCAGASALAIVLAVVLGRPSTELVPGSPLPSRTTVSTSTASKTTPTTTKPAAPTTTRRIG